MINCFTCYQCKHIGNILYCPFFALDSCYRGEHELVVPEVTSKAKKLVVPKSGSRCYQYHKFIFNQIKNKKSIMSIAQYLSIPYETLNQYVEKVLAYNNITKEELKYYTV